MTATKTYKVLYKASYPDERTYYGHECSTDCDHINDCLEEVFEDDNVKLIGVYEETNGVSVRLLTRKQVANFNYNMSKGYHGNP